MWQVKVMLICLGMMSNPVECEELKDDQGPYKTLKECQDRLDSATQTALMYWLPKSSRLGVSGRITCEELGQPV